jgi:hypothetical protein
MTDTVSFGNEFSEKTRKIRMLLADMHIIPPPSLSTFSENDPDTDSY